MALLKKTTRPVASNVRVTGAPGPTKLVRKATPECPPPSPPFGGPDKLQPVAKLDDEPKGSKQIAFKAGPHDQRVVDLIAAQHDGDKAAALRAAVRHYAFAIGGHDATLTIKFPDGHEERHSIKRGGLLC
jgi:hypothetical protein